MLTHKVIIRIDLPHEPGQWVEAHLPSKLALDRASAARQRVATALVRDLGVEMFEALQGLSSPTAGQEVGAAYDWYTLLCDCITAWSYEDGVSADAIGGLDEETVRVVLEAITHQPTDDERKNGSWGSTSTSVAMGRLPMSG